jgi:hypothetical protein
MKEILAALMCFVFALTQAFAISGGPPYPGSTNIVGVYAGVMKRPVGADSVNGCSTYTSDCAANSLGVFSVGVPTSGTATGTFVMFSQGRVFNGTIQGTADPGKDANSARINAVLSASFNFTVTGTPCPDPTPSPSCTVSSEEVTASANGSLNAHIKSELSRTFLGGTSVRLVGLATIDISQGHVDKDTLEPCVTCHMTLTVRGFKQTDTAPTSSILG